MNVISGKSLKLKITDILKIDYQNKKSRNLPLSAFALYQINIKSIKNKIITNFSDYDVKSKIQLSKLLQIDKSLDSLLILDIINKEKSAQIRSLLYLHFQYYMMDKHLVPILILSYWKEKSLKVKISILKAIRTQLKEKCVNVFIDALKNENNKTVLITIFQTLRSIKNNRIIESTLNWIENKGRYYDFDTYHHALMILIETDDMYLQKSNFISILKKSNIDLHTSWNEETYDACKRFFDPNYNAIGFLNPFRSISLYPENYFPHIQSILSSGILSIILSDELQNQNDRDYFIDLIKFCVDILNIENPSTKRNIITKNPNIYTKFENNIDFNISKEFSMLLDYHKLESTCKICKSHFVHYWPFQPFYSTKNKLIISKDYCTKHRFIELKQVAYRLVTNDYLRSKYPISRKINILKKSNRDRKSTLFIQSIWKNEILKCKCGEQNYPLTIDNRCPLCHMKKNLDVNKNFINILNSFSEIESVHYDYFELQLAEYYETIEILKNKNYDFKEDRHFLESYLFNEQQLILSWYIAQKIYDKVEYYDAIQWKSEQKAVDLISEILKTEEIIRYKSWSWLKSPISGYSMNVDAFFPEFNLALEYQGLQHYEPVEYFGGEASYNNQRIRDLRKKELLKEHGINLVEIKEGELNKEHIMVKLKIINNKKA